MTPYVQVSGPLRFRVAEPYRYPLARFTGPTKATGAAWLNPTMPPLRFVVPVTLYPPVKVSIPLLKLTVPGPLIFPLKENVAVSNCRVPTEAVLHVPGQLSVQVPPPVKSTVPELAITAPVLLNVG